MGDDSRELLVERSDGVVTVTLNRPAKKNAIDALMITRMRQVLVEIGDRDDDKVVVITGAGGDFSSGADLSGEATRDLHPLVQMQRAQDVARALHQLPKPTIAKVRGFAVGAGCSIALLCDLIIASDDAKFSEIFARRGLSMDFGSSWTLPRLVGLHRAKELALLADIVPATEAERIGLVNRIVGADELDEFVHDWARRLAAGPPIALMQNKQLLNGSLTVTLEQALESETRAQAINMATCDWMEARTAFVEGREARFTGASRLH